MKGGHRDEIPERGTPGHRTILSISPSKNARLHLLIGILSTISIWVILHCPWSTFVQNITHGGGFPDATSYIVPDAPDSTLLGTALGKMELVGRVALLALLSLIAHASPTDPQDSFEFDCVALPYHLNESNTPNTTVSLSQYVKGGSTLDLSGVVNSTCMGTNGGSLSLIVPFDVCRVAAYTATSETSGIHYEVWLPRSWSGRFMSHGNGGLSGCITLTQM
jgi:hypothetical protein